MRSPRSRIGFDRIGSTAVVGLPAKPIIDIDVSVDDPDDEAMHVPALERAGYRLRVRERGHRRLRPAALDVHVHVCATGSDWERRLSRTCLLRVSGASHPTSAIACLCCELCPTHWTLTASPVCAIARTLRGYGGCGRHASHRVTSAWSARRCFRAARPGARPIKS